MSYPPPPGPQDWEDKSGPAYGQQGQQPYGYQQPAYGAGPNPYGPPPQTSGKATTSLVLGVISMVCFGFLTGIPAIIVGIRARKDIRLSHGRTTGDGLALGGIITGIIGTLLGVALVALFIGVIALGSSVDGVVDRTCDQLAQDNDVSNDCT
jgi:hypothetical protein